MKKIASNAHEIFSNPFPVPLTTPREPRRFRILPICLRRGWAVGHGFVDDPVMMNDERRMEKKRGAAVRFPHWYKFQ